MISSCDPTLPHGELLHFARLGGWDPTKAPALSTDVGSDLFRWRKCQSLESLSWLKGGKRMQQICFLKSWNMKTTGCKLNDFIQLEMVPTESSKASTDSNIQNISLSTFLEWYARQMNTHVGTGQSPALWGAPVKTYGVATCVHILAPNAYMTYMYVVNLIKWHESLWEKISMNHNSWFMIRDDTSMYVMYVSL